MKHTITKILTALSVVALACACSNDDGPKMNWSDDVPQIVGLTASDSVAGNNLNRFSLKLFEQIASGRSENESANFVFSPYSVNMMLALLAQGADGITLDEILDAMGMPGDKNTAADLSRHFRLLTQGITTIDPTSTVTVGCRMWSTDKSSVESTFVADARQYFSADLVSADPSTTEGAALINQWIADNTNGMIQNMYQSASGIDFVAANALYFNGSWRYPFGKANTRKSTFHNADGSESTADMMNATMRCESTYVGKDQLVQLDFGNRAFTMKLILPAKDRTTHDVVRSLASDPDYLSDFQYSDRFYSTGLKSEREISLPRFEAEFMGGIPSYLHPLGIRSLFDNPDLHRMTSSPVASLDIQHGAKIKLSEDGVEFAGATDIYWIGASGDYEERLSYPIVFDRPFVFIVSETTCSSILCAGVINKL